MNHKGFTIHAVLTAAIGDVEAWIATGTIWMAQDKRTRIECTGGTKESAIDDVKRFIDKFWQN